MEKTFLKIDQPCSENWNSMTPNEKGRFCSLCSKTVIDFIKLNQYEIANEMEKSDGNLCIRVTQLQLDLPLDFTTKNKNSLPYSNIAASLMIAATLSATQYSQAQSVEQNNQVEKIADSSLKESKNISGMTLKNNNKSYTSRILRGQVCTESGLPIKNAKIALETIRNDILAYTIEDGTFALQIPVELIDDEILIKVTYNKIKRKSLKSDNYQYYKNAHYVLTKEDLISVFQIIAISESARVTMGPPSVFNIGF